MIGFDGRVQVGRSGLGIIGARECGAKKSLKVYVVEGIDAVSGLEIL